MTSFAFILGCVPLWIAKGAGAFGRRILGSVVIVGMLAATGIAIFVIPSLFVMVEKFATRRRRQGAADGAEAQSPPAGPSDAPGPSATES
jgi:HAE1 family hydrophobic/amphiphilic exporter-1